MPVTVPDEAQTMTHRVVGPALLAASHFPHLILIKHPFGLRRTLSPRL